jgi:hypothetical protein
MREELETGRPKTANAGGESVWCRFLNFLPFICLLVWGVSSGLEFAQQPASPASREIYVRAAGDWEVVTVKGLPFSADGIRTVQQINPSGRSNTAPISPLSHYRIYRDKDGRVRQDLMDPGQGKLRAPSGLPLLVLLTDPVARIVYQFRPPRHTMRGTKIPDGEFRPLGRPPDVPGDAYELEAQEVEGFKATGWRWRVTWAHPSPVDGQPVEEAREDWYSPDLQVSLMMARRDSKSLENVWRLSNVVQEEPPADLFQVPSDYTVEDTNQATIK